MTRQPRNASRFISSATLKRYFRTTRDRATWPSSGTRELVIPKTPFIVPYRLVGNTVQILRIFHGHRRWPEAL
jgi:plasmid stabilization system protein ParE